MKHLGMFIERLEVNSQVVVKVEQFDLDERLESLRGIN
jgi:phosphate starvation-inducible protein PhoH